MCESISCLQSIRQLVPERIQVYCSVEARKENRGEDKERKVNKSTYLFVHLRIGCIIFFLNIPYMPNNKLTLHC